LSNKLPDKTRDIRENNIEPNFCATCKDYEWCKKAAGVSRYILEFSAFMKQRKEED